MSLWQITLKQVKSLTQQRHITITVPVALLCLSLVSTISLSIVGPHGTPPLLASMGAAAVLMFYAPASPMATLWAFLGGNLLSAAIGVTCRIYLPESPLVGPLAVTAAIFVMHLCRCQHPPGGATALVAVIGGPEIHQLGYAYVITPVLLNLCVFLLGVLLHRQLLRYLAHKDKVNAQLLSLIQKNTYETNRLRSAEYQFNDLERALKYYDSTLDINTKQLDDIFQLTLLQAKTRQLKHKNCGDVVIGQTATVEYGEYLFDAFNKMQGLNVESLIVLDRSKHVLGYLSLTHILNLLNLTQDDTSVDSIRLALQPSGNLHSEKIEFVGQVMQTVPLVNVSDSVINIVLQGESDIYAVIDEQDHFVGVIDRNRLIT